MEHYYISSHYITRYHHHKKQFKIVYNYFDDNGIYHRGKTGWHYSRKEGKLRAMANIKNSKTKSSNKQNLTLKKAMDEYLRFRDLDDKKRKEELKKGNLIDIACNVDNTQSKYTKEMQTLYNKIPSDLARVKMKDLTVNYLAIWYESYIDEVDMTHKRGQNYRGRLRIVNEHFRKYGYLDKDFSLNALTSLNQARTIDKLHKTKRQKKKMKVVNGQVLLRNYPTSKDMKIIRDYLEERLGNFETFYWYALFNVAFYTGARPSELIALKWKNIDFKKRQLHFEDAISDGEDRELAVIRKDNGINHMKTANANRVIDIFINYLFLLEDFYLYSKYHYGRTDEEMQNKYIFQNLHPLKKYGYECTYFKNLNRKLASILPKMGLDKFTLEDFRRGCAHWLHDEMGCDLEFAEAYFGHDENSSLLKEVYGAGTKKAKVDKIKKNDNIKALIVDDDALGIKNDKPKMDAKHPKTLSTKILSARARRLYREYLIKKDAKKETTFHYFQFDHDNENQYAKRNKTFYHPEIKYIKYIIEDDLIPNKLIILQYYHKHELKRENII